MAMSQRPRHATLRRQRDDPHVRNNTQQNFRKPPAQAVPVVPEPMARLPRWPKNVFFASDFIADRASTAAAAAVAAAAAAAGATVSSSNPRHTVRESIGRGRKASHPREGVGALNMDRRSDRRSSREASVRSEPSGRNCAVRRSGNKTEMRMAQEDLGCEGREEQSGNRSTIHNSSTRKVPAVAGKKESLFLEESASALLFLHSRFFRGVQRDEDLVCRLCMLCKEAGWMGDPRGVYSGLDPLVLDGLLAERLDAKKRRSKAELQGLEHPDRHHRNRQAGGGVFSFEDFYQTLADIACLVYPHEANDQDESGARSGRAMQMLLLEGVIPLAADSKPRVWSPRPEVLYGRPALIALQAQRDSLHELYCRYSNTSRARTGAAGFNRSAFLRMLRDLGASPGSVSGEQAKAVFDAVLRNGLPETQSSCDSKSVSRSNHAMDNDWVKGGTAENVVARKGRKEVADKLPISRGGRLCWSLFLEVMAALAVGAVEDRHYSWAARRNDCTTRDRTNDCTTRDRTNDCTTRDSGGCPKPSHRDSQDGTGNHYPRRPGTIGGAKETPSRRDGSGSRLSARQEECMPSDAARCRDDEMSDFDESQNGYEKRRHQENEERKLTESTSDRTATAGLSSKTDRHLQQWRGSCQFDDTRKMELMPTLPESNVVQEEQVGVPARHRFSPEQSVVQRDGYRGGPVAFPPKTACKNPEATTITVNATSETRTKWRATATPMPAAVVPKDARQTENNELLADRAHVTPYNDEQRPSVASLRQGFPLSLHTVADERAPFSGGTRVTGLAEQKRLMKENGTAMNGSTQPFGRLVAEDEFWTVAENKKCNASQEGLRSTSGHERPIGRGKQTENPISNENRFDTGVTTSEGRAMKRQPCAASGIGCAALQAHDELEAPARPQMISVRRAAAAPTAAIPPSTGEFRPFWIEEDRGKQIDHVQTPAPCHGSSPSVVASSAKPGFKGAKLLEPVAPQPRNTVANITPAVSAGGLENCANPIPNEGVPSEGLRQDPRSCDIIMTVGHRRAEINRTEDEDRCGSGRTEKRGDSTGESARACRPALRAGRATATAGAAACTTVIFEELLDPKVVAVYSRHREQLISLFRRYSTGPNHDDGGATSCSRSEEPSGCVEDAGMRKFVNDFPSLGEWAQGEGILQLFVVVRASSDRGWRSVKGGSGVDKLRGASCASSGLCYLGFLEVLTRMAHAAKGNSPTHEKLLAMVRPLQADDHHPRTVIYFAATRDGHHPKRIV